MGLLKRFVILAALATGIGGIGGCYVSAHPAHPYYYGYGYGYRYAPYGGCGPYRHWNGFRCI